MRQKTTIHLKYFHYISSRFLQDSRQSQLLLPYTDSDEHAKLMELAKLYSLTMHLDNGRAVLSKTMYE